MPLYQLTLLLTGGHMAEHLLIEFTNRWGYRSDESLSNSQINTLKTGLNIMMVATGSYSQSNIEHSETSIKELLEKYNVGTEKSKTVRHRYPDPNLMLPIRLLPSVSVKSVKKERYRRHQLYWSFESGEEK